jgi:transposase
MPANILNLPQYRVLRFEETEHDYHVIAEPLDATSSCPHCESDRLTSWGTRDQVFKDLPMHGKRVGIYINTKRLRCQSCSKTFSQSLPVLAENRMMTERLVKWIGQQSLKRTFTSLAEETGVVEGTIRNIFRDYINELERTVRFETPQWMGIDEIYLIKPRCVITNIQNNTIVDMLANRNKDTVAKYLCQMKHRDKVQFVAMDMWAPYRDAVTAVMPQAKIVIGKFHVIKMANEAMEKARKGIRADLDAKQRRGLMHDRFVLLKRKNDLTDKEAFNLDGWTKNYPVLGEAYKLKESFYAVYEASTSKEDALARYEAWSKSVPPEIRPHFSDLIRAFTNWQPWILNYFDHKVTNAYTESLNSLIRGDGPDGPWLQL